MENMDMNEIITNDAVEEATEAVTEAVTSGKNGVKTGLIVGGAMVVGAMLWEHVVKPIGRKVRIKIAQKKALKAKKAKEEVDLEDMEIEDIPEVE